MIRLNDAFWANRALEHEQRMKPSWYDKEHIARPVLMAFQALAVVFAGAGIVAPIIFSATMAIPALGLILASVLLLTISMRYKRDDYSQVDPAYLIERERKAFNLAGNIKAKMRELEGSGSPMTADELISIHYHFKPEDFDFHELVSFINYQGLQIFSENTLKKLRKAFLNSRIGFLEKSKLCAKLGISKELAMQELECSELVKSYPEFIERNGSQAYNYLTSSNKERYIAMVKHQRETGINNHEMGWSWIIDLHRAGLELDQPVEHYRTKTEELFQNCKKFAMASYSADPFNSYIESMIDLWNPAFVEYGIINKEWSHEIIWHFIDNYWIVDDEFGPLQSHPFYISLVNHKLIDQSHEPRIAAQLQREASKTK